MEHWLDKVCAAPSYVERAKNIVMESKRSLAIAQLRALGWTVFCDEEEDDGEVHG